MIDQCAFVWGQVSAASCAHCQASLLLGMSALCGAAVLPSVGRPVHTVVQSVGRRLDGIREHVQIKGWADSAAQP
jgi:hypothetical protein